jgi:hypothetical protein
MLSCWPGVNLRLKTDSELNFMVVCSGSRLTVRIRLGSVVISYSFVEALLQAVASSSVPPLWERPQVDGRASVALSYPWGQLFVLPVVHGEAPCAIGCQSALIWRLLFLAICSSWLVFPVCQFVLALLMSGVFGLSGWVWLLFSFSWFAFGDGGLLWRFWWEIFPSEVVTRISTVFLHSGLEFM